MRKYGISCRAGSRGISIAARGTADWIVHGQHAPWLRTPSPDNFPRPFAPPPLEIEPTTNPRLAGTNASVHAAVLRQC